MQKRTTKIFSRYLCLTKPAFYFLYPIGSALPGLPGREGDGAGEGEQVEGRGDQGRGGQEGGGEEARGGGAREEARQGRHPRQVEDFYSPSLLILELLQAADAAEPADRAEDQRLCEAADVRERSRVGDVEEEEALPNFCIRFVFFLSLSFFKEEKAIHNFCIRIVFLLYIYVESSNLQQDCFLMESFVAGY